MEDEMFDRKNIADRALTLITQHMHDCEIRAGNFSKQLEEQDRTQERMHEQNTSRLETLKKDVSGQLNRLMFLIVSTLAVLVGGMALEILREFHK